MNNSVTYIHKFTAIVLLMYFMVPMVVKTQHALYSHQENHCTETSKVHFHKTELNCDFDTYQVITQFFQENISYKLILPSKVNSVLFENYLFLSDYQKLHFALRAPPSNS